MKVTLIVLRSHNIELAKEFYEDILGLKFREEKHGSGPRHFSTEIDGLVLEIYPKATQGTEGLRIGLNVDNKNTIKEKLRACNIGFKENEDSIIFCDIDKHKIEVRETQPPS